MTGKGTHSDSLNRCILGTAGLGGVWGKVEGSESVKAILMAMEKGIKAIDTAPAYGHAEQYVGEALRQWQGERPAISTKVGRLQSFDADNGRYDYSPAAMERSINESLRIMRLDQIDVLFLHDPSAIAPQEVDRILETLISFKQKGYAQYLGLGGNAPLWFKDYISSDVFDVLMEYNRLNVCCTTALLDTLPYCLKNKMKYYAASPLNMGLLGSRFKEFTNSAPAWLNKDALQTALKLNEIAKQHQLSLSTIAHRFLLSITDDVSIVIGASNGQQLANTFDDFHQGPLPANILEEILSYLEDNQACIK